VLAIEPADKSPFLGDVRSGSHQSCLETNMYRAPTFPHKVASTDYLLVRSPKGMLSLRRIDKLYAVGQQVSPCAEILYSISAECSTLSNFPFDLLEGIVLNMFTGVICLFTGLQICNAGKPSSCISPLFTRKDLPITF
jgi:hypothetical protein